MTERAQTPFPTSTTGVVDVDLGAAAPDDADAVAARDQRGDDLLQRVVAGAHETIDRLAQQAAPHVERIQRAGDSWGVDAEHLQALGDEWTRSLRDTVRANPLAAVTMALALGVLVARVSR